MANQRKSYSDRSLGKSFNRRAYRAITRQYPFFIGSIISFIQLVAKSAAFSIRVFLRKDIGERTFGIWSIVLAYFWVQYFLLDSAILTHLDEDFKFFGIIDFHRTKVLSGEQVEIFSLKSWDDLLRPLYVCFSYMYQVFVNLLKLTDLLGEDNARNGSWVVWIYSYIVVLLGVVHLFKGIWRTNTWDKKDSYRRGTSVFFQWSIDQKIGQFSITPTAMLTIVEPIAVFVLGLLVYNIWDNPNSAFGMFLMVSAIALASEEYTEYLFRQEKILDMVDSEFDGQRLEVALEKYEEKERVRNGRNDGDFSRGVVIPPLDYKPKRRNRDSSNQQPVRFVK